MAAESEQLEREARRSREKLAVTLEQLRKRLTPGQVLDQTIDYMRDGPAAEFLRNLGRDVRENPMPLVLIGIGVAWLMAASNRTSRKAIANAADAAEKGAAALGTAADTAARKMREWLPAGRSEAALGAEQPADPSPIVAISDYDEAMDARAAREMDSVHGDR
jgi:Protein of unknown function (DUF3618)